jgi:hypothetical protein
MEDVGRLLMRQMITQPMAMAIGDAFTSVFSMHGGGEVGKVAGKRRSVSSLAVATAPRLHGGLNADEFAAVLQTGETVLPRGAKPNVTVNIDNQSGAAIEVAPPDVSFDPRRMVIGIALKDARTYGPMSRAFGR